VTVLVSSGRDLGYFVQGTLVHKLAVRRMTYNLIKTRLKVTKMGGANSGRTMTCGSRPLPQCIEFASVFFSVPPW
jgi:hypothetical protein